MDELREYRTLQTEDPLGICISCLVDREESSK
jgi:hypothetical protein